MSGRLSKRPTPLKPNVIKTDSLRSTPQWTLCLKSDLWTCCCCQTVLKWMWIWNALIHLICLVSSKPLRRVCPWSQVVCDVFVTIELKGVCDGSFFFFFLSDTFSYDYTEVVDSTLCYKKLARLYLSKTSCFNATSNIYTQLYFLCSATGLYIISR